MKTNTFEKVIQGLQKRKKEIYINPDKYPFIRHEYKEVLEKYNTNEISADHIFLKFESALNENKYYHNEFSELDPNLWLFATTGQGDMWFVDLQNHKIRFYDHNFGNLSKGDMLNVNINVVQWIILSDLVRQCEEITCFTHSDSAAFNQLLENISTGLSEVYPYRW